MRKNTRFSFNLIKNVQFCTQKSPKNTPKCSKNTKISMKTDEKTRKNVQNDAKKRKKEQISAIYSAIDYLRGLGIVKNQKEFAEYIGVTQQAISYALREDSEFSNKRLMHRIEEKMKADHNYDIYAPRDIYVTGDAIAAPSALSIIERYKGVSPDGRIFPFVSDVHYNRSIRLILQAAGIDRPVIVRDPKTGASSPHPICEIASSHLARRTFTQLAYARTGEQRLVSSMTGHIPNSAAFSRYSKVTREMKLRALGIENAPSLPSEDARTKKSIP